MTDTGAFTRGYNRGFDIAGVGPIPCPSDPTCVTYAACVDCCEDQWAEYDPSLQSRAEVLAWNTLRTLSGGLVGNCPVVMRPCLSPPCDWCSANWLDPRIIGGEWFNNPCGCTECSCARLCEIVFPGPVAEVLDITLDGEAVPLSAVRIDNGNRLVRQDGQCWPSCQDMGKPLGAQGTLGITYVPGIKPDDAGLWAAGVLACEFAKACSGGKCQLPSSVTTIARQGVQFQVSTSMFENGTGIREVDAYLETLNPYRLRIPSTVWSPDLEAHKHRYTTWSAPVVTP